MREAENKEDALKKDVETGKNDSGKRQNEDRLQKAFVKNEIITADLSVQEIDYICRKITPKAIRAYLRVSGRTGNERGISSKSADQDDIEKCV